MGDKKFTEDLLIRPEEKLMDITNDTVFKFMLTMDTKESKETLRRLISVLIEKEVNEVTITTNEPQTGNIKQKPCRLDVNCKFDGKQSANVEMTMGPDKSEFIRIEHYWMKIGAGRDTKNVKYEDFPYVYQISFLGRGNLSEDDEPINRHGVCNLRTKKIMNTRGRIITVEFNKLKNKIKSIETLSEAERWAAYIAWVNDKSKINLVNELIKKDGGLRMATNALRQATDSHLLQMELASQKKYRDIEFNRMARAKREGRAKGRAEGEQIGEEKGRKKGRAEMKAERDIEIARNSLKEGFTLEQISKITGLTIEQIQELKQ
jgi:predicted transposase/invertase (TIGR01784 family)